MATREQLDIILSARNETSAAFAAVRRELQQMQSGALTLAGAFGKLGAPIGFAALVVAGRDAIKVLGNVADEADRVGTSTDVLQTLQFQLRQSGGASEDAVAGLQRFGKAAAEAGLGGNYLTKVFQANGVALKDQNGNLRSADALLQEYARLVSGAGSQQEKLMLASEAFGRQAGPKMVAMLERIAREGLPALTEEAKKAGIAIDENLVRKADEIDDAFDRMITQSGNKLKSWAVNVVSAGSTIADWMNRNTVGTGGALSSLTEQQRLAHLRSTGSADLDDPLRKIRATSLVPTKLPPKNDPRAEADRNRSKEVLEILRLETDQITLNLDKKREAERLEQQIIRVRAAGLDASAAEQAQIRGAVDALFAKRAAFEEHKRQVEGYNDAIKMGGDALVDSLDGLISKTKTWEEVLQSTLAMLQRAVLQAAILGEGPLAGLLGTKSKDGNAGGLLGTIFSGLLGRSGSSPAGPDIYAPGFNTNAFGGPRAGGGDVDPGHWYKINEQGEEMFIPGRSGRMEPVGGASAAPPIVMHNDFRGASPDAVAGINLKLDQLQRAIPGMIDARTKQNKVISPGVSR